MSLLLNPPQPTKIKELLFKEAAAFQHPNMLRAEIDPQVVAYSGAYIGSSIDCHGTIDRAMDLGRELILEKESAGSAMASGHVILAEQMSSSKGRFTRSWHAPEGGLWGCLIHANNLLNSSRQFLPFVVGISCCEAMQEIGVPAPKLRWVNDVLVANKKIAGFLIESFTSPMGENFHMVGFGINVNNSSFPDELKEIATSVKKEKGGEIDLSTFAELFLAKMAWNIGLLEVEETHYLREDSYFGLNGEHIILEKFKALTDTIGQKVSFGFDVIESPQYTATVKGLDSFGGLELELEDGYRKVEYSGEIRYL